MIVGLLRSASARAVCHVSFQRFKIPPEDPGCHCFRVWGIPRDGRQGAGISIVMLRDLRYSCVIKWNSSVVRAFLARFNKITSAIYGSISTDNINKWYILHLVARISQYLVYKIILQDVQFAFYKYIYLIQARYNNAEVLTMMSMIWIKIEKPRLRSTFD